MPEMLNEGYRDCRSMLGPRKRNSLCNLQALCWQAANDNTGESRARCTKWKAPNWFQPKLLSPVAKTGEITMPWGRQHLYNLEKMTTMDLLARPWTLPLSYQSGHANLCMPDAEGRFQLSIKWWNVLFSFFSQYPLFILYCLVSAHRNRTGISWRGV